MKGLLFVLCSVNLVLAVLLWVESRDLAGYAGYVEVDSVKRLGLLSAPFVSSNEGEGSKRCLAVGPYQNRSEAEQIRSVLFGGGYLVDLVDQQVEKAPSYWVHYGVVSGKETVQEVVGKLKSSGLDSYVISRGDLKGKLSLGVFENIDSAQRMIKIARKIGYTSQMTEIPNQESEYWVMVDIAYSVENKRKIGLFLSDYSEESEMRQIFCKSVASEN